MAPVEHHIVGIDQWLRSAEPPLVAPSKLDAWRFDLERRDRSGDFFFAEPAVIVTTRLVG